VFRRTHVLAIVMMAVGALLGYAAASGKWNPLPQPSATAALEGQALRKPGGSCTEESPRAPCCSDGATRGTLVARADEEALLKGGGQPSAPDGKKPNIVMIMTDDVGWGDLGCYGGGVMRGAPTPHLDRLAAEGMRFVNYYGQASCTAGRASFITGRIPIRTALSLVLVPGDPDHITNETPTVAQFLKEKAGYTSVQLGKWHLGDVPEAYPTANGFDEMYHMLPYYAGVYAYDDPNLNSAWPKNDAQFMAIWNKYNLSEWEGKAGQPAKKVRERFDSKNLVTSDTEIRETAVKWIKDHAKDDKPFFMYCNFMKVHQPNFPAPEWKGKSPAGMPYQAR
jgi:arylsulfatase A-like enzyme